jgi:hypothetical protein
MLLNKRKLIAKIERMMVEQELELHGLDSQHSRAYHTGMIDGLGMALFAYGLMKITTHHAKQNEIGKPSSMQPIHLCLKVQKQSDQGRMACKRLRHS